MIWRILFIYQNTKIKEMRNDKNKCNKIDDKGRINLPAHFLKANNIQKGCEVIIEAIINNSDAVKLKFKGVADAK